MGTLANFQQRYNERAIPEMVKKFGYRNKMQAPRLLKIVVNMGVGRGTEDIKIVETAQKELTTITGQYAVITRAKKAISNFKIKEGSPVGCRVTLRRKTMYEFLERLVCAALPRVRDFRGLSPRGFDQAGNYTFGMNEQTIFPEIETDKISRSQGMNITIVIRSHSKEESYELLSLMGVPFRARPEKSQAQQTRDAKAKA